MKNRFPRPVLFLFLLLSACSPTTRKDKPGGGELETPNVLFIAVDDLRPELGSYDKPYIKSPNIDKLASEGVVFTRAYCNIPVCGASRASLLSGTRPTRNRFIHYYTRLDLERPDVETLPEHFRNLGYHTISNNKIFHDADDSEESWDEMWTARSNVGWRDYYLEENIRTEKETGKGPSYEAAEAPDTVYKDGKLARKGIEDLRKLKAMDKPFFLALGFLKPHLPFNAPRKYWDWYDPSDIRLPENSDRPEGAPDEAMHNWGELRGYGDIPSAGPLSDEKARKLIHGYRACVSYTDAQIGLVLDELDRLGLKENTIVILWGDHGWNLREHGLWCKHCNFNTSLNAPVIVSVPGKLKGHRTDEIIEFVDIYPTLCDLAGLEKPAHLEGASFAHLMDEPDGKTDGVAVSRWHEGITVIKDQIFFTEWLDEQDDAYASMMYDHSVDPGETRNVADDDRYRDIKMEYQALLRANRGDYHRDSAEVKYDRD